VTYLALELVASRRREHARPAGQGAQIAARWMRRQARRAGAYLPGFAIVLRYSTDVADDFVMNRVRYRAELVDPR
jgi:hypothetical protein